MTNNNFHKYSDTFSWKILSTSAVTFLSFISTIIVLFVYGKFDLFSFKKLTKFSSNEPQLDISSKAMEIIYADNKVKSYRINVTLDSLEKIKLILTEKYKNGESSDSAKIVTSVKSHDSIPCQVVQADFGDKVQYLKNYIQSSIDGRVLNYVVCDELHSSKHVLDLQLIQLKNENDVPLVLEAIGTTKSGENIGNGIELKSQ